MGEDKKNYRHALRRNPVRLKRRKKKGKKREKKRPIREEIAGDMRASLCCSRTMTNLLRTHATQEVGFL